MLAVKKALQELADKVKKIVLQRVKDYGYNERAHMNTLENSDLIKNMKVTPTDDGLALQIASYWEFVSRGWQRTHNYPDTYQAFVTNVDRWVTKKGIRFGDMPQAQVVFLIIRNIWLNAIKARPFLVYNDDGDLEKMIPELEGIMDKWFDELFEAIMTDVNKHFNNK